MLYVYSITVFVALSLIGSFSKATIISSVHANPASLAMTSIPLAVQSKNQFKSFREWKNSMIASADGRLKQSQDAISAKQRTSASESRITTEAGILSNLTELQNQAEKDMYQVSMAKDLTISDYFVGYLTKQKDMPAAINEVSGRLTAEEIAELMSAYANNFFTSQPVTAAPLRSGSNQ
ncbi:MAG: hypothetical protein WA160_05295 [Pseudobdellovibrio sp.]